MGQSQEGYFYMPSQLQIAISCALHSFPPKLKYENMNPLPLIYLLISWVTQDRASFTRMECQALFRSTISAPILAPHFIHFQPQSPAYLIKLIRIHKLFRYEPRLTSQSGQVGDCLFTKWETDIIASFQPFRTCTIWNFRKFFCSWQKWRSTKTHILASLVGPSKPTWVNILRISVEMW